LNAGICVPHLVRSVYTSTLRVIDYMRYCSNIRHGLGRIRHLGRAVLVLVCVCAVAAAEAPKAHLTEASPLSLADEAYKEGRFQDALKLYSQVPDRAVAFLGSGMAHEMLNRSDRAAEDYRKAIDADPGNYRAMEDLAGIYERERREKRIPEAIKLYKQALKLDPRKDWQDNLAVCIAILQSRLRSEDSYAVGCWNLANRNARTGHEREAELLYGRAIQLDPDMFQAYYRRGLLRLKLGRLKEALDDFDDTARIDPKFRGAYVQKGLTHEKLEDSAAAKHSFKLATRNDPNDPQAWYELGYVLEQTGQYPKAMECFEHALRLRTKPELRKLIRERIVTVWNAGNFDSKKDADTLKKLKKRW
jgi:tetratricopeptide (TPR) repeat protein